MIVADEELDPAQAAFLKAAEEVAPMDFSFAQSHANAEDAASAGGFNAEGNEHRAIEHATVLADFFIAGVNDDIGEDAQGRVAPGFQMSVEFGGALADLGGTDGTAAEFLDDRRNLAGGDALDVHLSQSKLERQFATEAFFQGAGIEIDRASNLRHGQFKGAHTGFDGLCFEAVGVALPGVGALVRLSAEGYGALTNHGLVEEDTESFEETAEAIVVELLQYGVQEFRVVLVGHEGLACCCVW